MSIQPQTQADFDNEMMTRMFKMKEEGVSEVDAIQELWRQLPCTKEQLGALALEVFQ